VIQPPSVGPTVGPTTTPRPKRRCHPQLLGWKGFHQDRLRGREHGAAAGALDETEITSSQRLVACPQKNDATVNRMSEPVK